MNTYWVFIEGVDEPYVLEADNLSVDSEGYLRFYKTWVNAEQQTIALFVPNAWWGVEDVSDYVEE